MKKATEFHQKAIALAEQADLAKAAQDFEAARRLYYQAYELERNAALQFLRKHDVEPTRSVLFRSAASLALDCGEFSEAERMICHGLAAEPPVDIRVELRQLYEQMHFRLFLQDAGLHLIEQQIIVSLWGEGIAPDFVPLREVMQRLNRAERLIYRTAERKSGLPFLEQDAPKAIRDRYPIFQRMQLAASYAVVLQVGQTDRQLELPYTSAIDAADIVSEVVDCMELYNSEDASGLKERIEDPAYRRNFVSIVNTLYPRTPGISGVGIAGVSSGGQLKRIELYERPHMKFEAPSVEGDERDGGEPLQIVGVLYSAKSTTRTKRVEIKDDGGTSHAIDVPEGMLADVVRPYFEARVIADVVRSQNGMLSLIEIHGEDDQATNAEESATS